MQAERAVRPGGFSGPSPDAAGYETRNSDEHIVVHKRKLRTHSINRPQSDRRGSAYFINIEKDAAFAYNEIRNVGHLKGGSVFIRELYRRYANCPVDEFRTFS